MTKLKIIADGRKIIPWNSKVSLWLRWDTILQAYNHPSIEKLKIWEIIEKNARKIEATVGINCKNNNFFTVHGFMLNDDGRRIEFKLTKSFCYFRYR